MPQIFDVRQFGAAGDGIADDARALNAALQAVPSRGGVLYFPAGVYRTTQGLRLVERSNVTVTGEGAGSVIKIAGPEAPFGVELGGACRNLVIRQLGVIGAATASSVQTGIGTATNSNFSGTGVWIVDCEVAQVNRGIYLEASPWGAYSDIWISRNRIHDIVGTDSGRGYGIANGGGYDVQITGNHLANCQRHSIYQAAGGRAMIGHNLIRDHRHGIATGGMWPALVVARSSDVVVAGNLFIGCQDGALSIEPHDTDPTVPSRNIAVIGNVFRDSGRQDLILGNQNPAGSGPLDTITVMGNTFVRKDDPDSVTEAIRIYGGKHIRIAGNVFRATGGYRVPYAAIVASPYEAAAGTDHLAIQENSAILVGDRGTVHFVELGAALCTGAQHVIVSENDVALQGPPGSTLVWYDVPPTSQTLLVSGAGVLRQMLDGWYRDDIGPSWRAVPLYRGVGSAFPAAWLAPRAGQILGVYVKANEPRRSGRLTVEVYRNAESTGLRVILDDRHEQFGTVRVPAGAMPFEAGDELELRLSTDQAFSPSTLDLRAGLEVQL